MRSASTVIRASIAGESIPRGRPIQSREEGEAQEPAPGAGAASCLVLARVLWGDQDGRRAFPLFTGPRPGREGPASVEDAHAPGADQQPDDDQDDAGHEPTSDEGHDPGD